MGKDWDRLGTPQAWQFSGGFSKPGIGDRPTAWPSFSGGDPVHGTANATCAVCGGRLRGKKKCGCPKPHDHWKPLGKPRVLSPGTVGATFTPGGSERFRGASLPSFTGSEPNWVCQTCGGTIRGKDRQGFTRCTCETPDVPQRGDYRAAQAHAIQTWHEGWLREAYRVLAPGGIVKAFTAPRTGHRLLAAMEAVGFDILDPELWVYGSGFPKSLKVSRAVDMEVCILPGRHFQNNLPSSEKRQEGDHVCPESEIGRPFTGFGTALKPSQEPFMVGRKPG